MPACCDIWFREAGAVRGPTFPVNRWDIVPKFPVRSSSTFGLCLSLVITLNSSWTTPSLVGVFGKCTKQRRLVPVAPIQDEAPAQSSELSENLHQPRRLLLHWLSGQLPIPYYPALPNT